MVSLPKAQTGMRRYASGFSKSPNKGPVSAKGAQGYIKREIANKQRLSRPVIGNTGFNGGRPVVSPKGRDGQSDRRSGLAAKVLNGGFGGKTDSKIQSGILGAQKQAVKQANPKPNGSNAVQGNAPQAVKAKANGVLELPYNQDFAEGQYAALEAANDALLGFKNEADTQALKYNQEKRNLDSGYGQQKLQTLNQNAAGGTAFSSMYGTAVAGNAQSYANAAGSLDQQNAAFQQDLAARRAASQSAFNLANSKGSQEYGDALGEQAGDLGYGQAQQVVKNNATGKVIPSAKAPAKPKPKKPASKKKPAPKKYTKAAKKSLARKVKK